MDSDCDLYLVFDNTLPHGNVLVCLFMLTQRQNLQFIKCLTKIQRKRPSVNYAKDWHDQLFLIRDLVWSGKGYHLWMLSLWGSRQPFFCVFGHFRHGDTQTIEQTKNNQPGDPRASLLSTILGQFGTGQFGTKIIKRTIWHQEKNDIKIIV